MNTVSTLALAVALSACSASFALAGEARHSPPPNQASETKAAMSKGEVRKIAKDTANITIRHGKLKNLDMPPMTMVFRVKDRSMLDRVKVGDKINFVADRVGGQLTVVKLELN